MKTNLKSFPDVHEWYYRKKVHDWKEAFAKELREELRLCRTSRFLWKQKAEFIEEVLGDV
jgi:hypothetical protein